MAALWLNQGSSITEELDAKIEGLFAYDAAVARREKAASRIKYILEGIARRLKLTGEVRTFGSFSNGFKNSSSDMDMVFLGPIGQDPVSALHQFAVSLPEVGFSNITKIFSAVVPLVKFTDRDTGMEVDFCINNELGVRNSLLLSSYNQYDSRVLKLGRLVKDWAKRRELTSSTDGCLNSYAYMLLVIHFLQSLPEPICPNLQEMKTESVLVTDTKWGFDQWETGFFSDVQTLPPSTNTMSVGELFVRFFHYYGVAHDWSQHAVCIRLNRPGLLVDKATLLTPSTKEQWYVEDPFDCKHNLAGKCTAAGRARILHEMRSAYEVLTQEGGWEALFPTTPPAEEREAYFLKCRVSASVTAVKLLAEFQEFGLHTLHMPKPDPTVKYAQAFLEFNDAHARRRAHTKNETYVEDCQLQLHYTSKYSFEEAKKQCEYTSSLMAMFTLQQEASQQRAKQPETAMSDVESTAASDGTHNTAEWAGKGPDYRNQAISTEFMRFFMLAQQHNKGMMNKGIMYSKGMLAQQQQQLQQLQQQQQQQQQKGADRWAQQQQMARKAEVVPGRAGPPQTQFELAKNLAMRQAQPLSHSTADRPEAGDVTPSEPRQAAAAAAAAGSPARAAARGPEVADREQEPNLRTPPGFESRGRARPAVAVGAALRKEAEVCPASRNLLVHLKNEGPLLSEEKRSQLVSLHAWLKQTFTVSSSADIAANNPGALHARVSNDVPAKQYPMEEVAKLQETVSVISAYLDAPPGFGRNVPASRMARAA